MKDLVEMIAKALVDKPLFWNFGSPLATSAR
jgi:hypothetical protein